MIFCFKCGVFIPKHDIQMPRAELTVKILDWDFGIEK